MNQRGKVQLLQFLDAVAAQFREKTVRIDKALPLDDANSGMRVFRQHAEGFFTGNWHQLSTLPLNRERFSQFDSR